MTNPCPGKLGTEYQTQASFQRRTRLGNGGTFRTRPETVIHGLQLPNATALRTWTVDPWLDAVDRLRAGRLGCRSGTRPGRRSDSAQRFDTTGPCAGAPPPVAIEAA